MSIYNFIFFIAFISSNILFCQSKKTDSIVKIKIYKLQNKNVKTIFSYKSINQDIDNTECGKYSTYIIWQKKRKTYFSIIKDCNITRRKKIKNSRLFEFYLSNKSIINTEKIPLFINQNGDLVGSFSSETYSLTIYDDKKVEHRNIDSFKLVKKSGNDINVNYEKTISLKSLELIKKIQKKLPYN